MNKEKNGSFKKIAFLDRDGVINKKPKAHQYVTGVHNFFFNKEIFKMLKNLKGYGFEFIIITNQRGIAKGIFSEEDLGEIHQYMIKIFKENQIDILDIFYCPHEIGTCNCRKPKPGLLIKATHKYKIDLKDSILISDNLGDIEMGKNFGIGRNFLIETDNPNILF